MGKRFEEVKDLGRWYLRGKESEEKKEEEDEEEKKRRIGQPADKQDMRLTQATQVIKLITLAASISVTKAEDGEEAEPISFEVIMIYTICVVFLTIMVQKLWNVGVRGAGMIHQGVLAQLGSHAEVSGEDGNDETSQGENVETSAPSFVKRPVSLEHADLGRWYLRGKDQAPQASSSSSGDQIPECAEPLLRNQPMCRINLHQAQHL